MGSTQSMWVGLDLCDGLGWVEFFWTHHDGLDQKIPSTQPNPTRPMHTPNENESLKMYHMVLLRLNSIRGYFLKGFFPYVTATP